MPANPGLVEAPAGLSPQEIRGGELARRFIVEHLGRRPNLNMDQLANAKDLRPRLETPNGLKLPGDSRGTRNRIWFFSIDATIDGVRYTGCLMAGECIMVQATSFEKANSIARDGLNDTPQIARDYFDELARSIVVASPLDVSHMNVDVGGRRAGEVPGQPDLATDPKLKAMIEHIIGRKPWRG